VDLPNKHSAGEILVVGSGPFLYTGRRTLWKLSDRAPAGPVCPRLALHGLDGHLCTAVGMGVVCRGHAVVDAPCLEECSGAMGSEFGTAV
jgi:hypothetical protein